MLFWNRRIRIFTGFVILVIFVSMMNCSRTGEGRLGLGARIFAEQEGWVNADTYRIAVYGHWDRSSFFRKGAEVVVENVENAGNAENAGEGGDAGNESDPVSALPLGRVGNIGRVEKTVFALREDAKLAAEVKAERVFKERLAALVSRESGLEEGLFVAAAIETVLQGELIEIEEQREVYSSEDDIRVMYEVTVRGLRDLLIAAGEEARRGFEEDAAIKKAEAEAAQAEGAAEAESETDAEEDTPNSY